MLKTQNSKLLSCKTFISTWLLTIGILGWPVSQMEFKFFYFNFIGILNINKMLRGKFKELFWSLSHLVWKSFQLLKHPAMIAMIALPCRQSLVPWLYIHYSAWNITTGVQVDIWDLLVMIGAKWLGPVSVIEKIQPVLLLFLSISSQYSSPTTPNALWYPVFKPR